MPKTGVSLASLIMQLLKSSPIVQPLDFSKSGTFEVSQASKLRILITWVG